MTYSPQRALEMCNPDLLTDEIISFVAGSKRFMPHFHIPLQSGSDAMLKLMRRHYDRQLFADKIAKIRREIPDAFIGVDLITGMRGETDEIFEDSKEFIASLDISRLHVFTYSERPGTMALNITPVVDQQTKHLRTRKMMALSDKKLDAFTRRYLGTVRPVLFEHTTDGGTMKGFSGSHIIFTSKQAGRPNYNWARQLKEGKEREKGVKGKKKKKKKVEKKETPSLVT